MEWRDVIGYEDMYEVSDTGMVRSKYRVIYRTNGRPYTVEPKTLSTQIRGNTKKRAGYFGVFFSTKIPGQKGKYVPNHRLVAEAFIEKIPGRVQVNHLDSDTFNNNVANLEWTNNRLNQMHSVLKGRRKDLKRVGIKDFDGNMLLYVSSIRTASTITGASRKAITNVSKGIDWHAKGFKFEVYTS